jgi:hypothetical protein
MSDDVDIGIGVRELPGSQAVVEALRAKLAAYRKELENLAQFEQTFGGQSGKGLEGSLHIIDDEVEDVTVRFARLASQIDVTNKAAVEAFNEETSELRRYLEGIDAATGAIDRLGLAQINLRERILATQQVSPGTGPSLGAATPDAGVVAPTMDKAAASTDRAGGSVQRLATDVNVAIGAFIRLGKIIDLSSQEAVSAYREEGDALAANLARLGATDTELNKIGASVAKVEQNYGAFNLKLNENVSTQDKVPVTARRGANAMATLAFGLEAGGTSARSAAIAIGSAVSATAAFADSAKVAAAATGIGALVTVLAVVIGLFYELNHEAEVTKSTLGDIGQLSTKQLRILHETNEANLAFSQNQAEAIARQVEQEAQSLNPIENVIAAFHTWRARKTQAHYKDLIALREELTKRLVEQEKDEARQLEEQGRKETDAANRLATDRVNGPAAARELAAKQERDDALRELAKKVASDSDIAKAREGILRQYTENVFAIERDRTQKIADLDRQYSDQVIAANDKLYKGQFQAQKDAADRKLALDKEKLEKDRDLHPEERNRLLLAAETAHTQQLLAIARDRGAKVADLDRQFSDQIAESEARLNEDVFAVQRAAVEKKFELDKKRITEDRDLHPDEVIKLTQEAERARTNAITALERDRSDKILEIRNQAQGKLDAISGSGVDEEKIRQSYKKDIDVLEAAIKSEVTTPAQKAAAAQGLKLIEALVPEEIAKARLDEIDKDVGKVLNSEQQQITRTNDLLAAHAITDQESRARILSALEAQRDSVARSIPLLEEQARRLPGDSDAISKVEAYKTKLLELTIAIAHASDEFYVLKESGINATEAGLQKLITSIPNVVAGQSQQINNINAMRVHLASAEAELADLMKGPQTAATAQRITQLRAEIQGVNIELGNAKRELITWKSIFLDAARSIVQALFEVEARMFAVYLVQQSLKLFGGGSSGGAASLLQLAGDVATGGTSAASGGLIMGPGSSTSDSIPARLSNGEFVIRAAAVNRVGAGFLHEINSLGSMPTAGRTRGWHHYADGGLVTDAGGGGPSGIHATLGLEDGLVLRHLQSREGDTVLLNWAERNKNKLRGLLG